MIVWIVSLCPPAVSSKQKQNHSSLPTALSLSLHCVCFIVRNACTGKEDFGFFTRRENARRKGETVATPLEGRPHSPCPPHAHTRSVAKKNCGTKKKKTGGVRHLGRQKRQNLREWWSPFWFKKDVGGGRGCCAGSGGICRGGKRGEGTCHRKKKGACLKMRATPGARWGGICTCVIQGCVCVDRTFGGLALGGGGQEASQGGGGKEKGDATGCACCLSARKKEEVGLCHLGSRPHGQHESSLVVRVRVCCWEETGDEELCWEEHRGAAGGGQKREKCFFSHSSSAAFSAAAISLDTNRPPTLGLESALALRRTYRMGSARSDRRLARLAL